MTKRNAASHGLYRDTVDGLQEDYIRPQENGAHGSCDYVLLESDKLRLIAVAPNPSASMHPITRRKN